MEELEISYELNNIIYKVIGSQELHNQLQNDCAFFEDYISRNAGALEMQITKDDASSEKIITEDKVSQEEPESWTWTRKSILLLLDCLEKRKLDLRNPKIKKKNLWKDIKNELLKHGVKNIDESVVERKFRNMKNTYKTIKDNKKKTSTGRGEVKWEYYEAMEKIFEEDETINIGHTISSFTTSTCVSVPAPKNTLNLKSRETNESRTVESQFQFASTGNMVIPDSLRVEIDNTNLSVQSSPLASPNDYVVASPTPSEQTQTPTSASLLKSKKNERGKQLYGLRKKQVEVEESRVKELQLLREAIEENNRIQKERNALLKLFLENRK